MMEWRRILWKNQGFPDNYVGDRFLRLQKKYAIISRKDAFYGSTLVTQEICSCFALTVVFWGLAEKRISASAILISAAILCSLFYFIVRSKSFFPLNRECISNLFVEGKVVFFALVLIWCSSPLIKTLTASVATDTIHALTTGLFFLHLVLHPYGASVALVNATISHNLGLFASVCLASRLGSNEDVFAFILVAVIHFTLLPGFRNHCREHFGRKSVVVITAALFAGSLFAGWGLVPSLCTLLAATVLLTNVVAPSLFLYLQPHRENLYGPWDEALITEKL